LEKSRDILESLTEEEQEMLKKFREMPDEDKKILSDYSGKLYVRSADAWKQWIKRRTEEQIRAAKMEGFR
jgi:cytoplasmic iron level regulating protein YaaA (DUF328/UPF0246 family)